MKFTGVLQRQTSPSLASKRLIAMFVVVVLILITYVQMTKFSSSEVARRTVIFMGGDVLDMSTASQRMSGDYQVKWKTTGICSFQADLNETSIFSTVGATRGAEKISLASGTYYIHMIKSQAFNCEWQVTFNPA